MSRDRLKNASDSIVYLVQCINDPRKVYIGKTDRLLEERRAEHEREALSGRSRPFLRELVEEGFKNWKWRVLWRGAKDQVTVVERNLIQEFNALPVDVLNVSHTSEPRRPEVRLRSEEAISKPSKRKASHSRTVGSRRGGKAVWQSESARKWMRISGKLKPVVNLDTGQRYFSLSQAASQEGHTLLCIKRSCDTGKPAPSGYRFAWLDRNDEPVLTPGHQKKWPGGGESRTW